MGAKVTSLNWASPGAWTFFLVAALAGAAAGLPAAWLVRRYDPERRWPPAWVAAIVVALALASAVVARPTNPRPLAWLETVVLGWTLATLALIDVRVHRLPDVLTLPLASAGLAFALVDGGAPLPDRVLGAAGAWSAMELIALVYRRARGREGLGAGDAKLLAAAGAWLGWRPLALTVLIACGLAFLWIAERLLRRRPAALARPVAFGAPLALAIWWVWLEGAPGG